MDSRREFSAALGATLIAGAVSMIGGAAQPIVAVIMFAGAGLILTWGWWPAMRTGRVPIRWSLIAGALFVAALLASVWKIAADAGFAEAQRVAKESLGSATIEVPVHNFSLGDAVVVSSDGSWSKAVATDAESTASAIVGGLSGSQVSLVRSGFVAVRHTLGEAGEILYLSQTVAGQLTAVPPESGISQPLGMVIGSNLLLIDVGEPWDLDADVFMTGKIRPQRESD